MKRGIRMTLLVLSVLLIVSELVYGIPFLGGSIVLSFGWQPLLINALLYFIMMFIPLLGVIGSFLAFIPLVGMVIHWILFFLMLFFIFILLSTPLYVPNKYAKVIYTEDRRKDH